MRKNSKVEQVIAWLLITIGGVGFLMSLYGWIFNNQPFTICALYALVSILFIRLAPIIARILTNF